MTSLRIQSVAARLPFSLDDTDQVNQAFIRWNRRAQHRDRETVDLWTYCFVYRYFLSKFAASKREMVLSLDQLVAKTFEDIQKHRTRIRQPGRYTGWVSKICRNTFINHLRLQRTTVSLEAGTLQVAAGGLRPEQSYDAALIYQTIIAALDAMPPFMGEVTRLRLLDKLSYEEIHARTGKPLPTLRVYMNRGMKYLRQHPEIQTLLGELID